MALRITRIMLIVSTLATVLALTAGIATASGSQILSLSEIHSANDGMGSDAVEWSGATYNGSSHVLLTLDDEHNAYEFQLNDDGSIDQDAEVRVIELDLGTYDFEGVAWISGEKYGFLSEGSGQVIIATMPAPSGNGTTTIDTGDIERSFPVISGIWGNLGPEGLATDGSAFYVTREMPATLSKFSFAGDFIASVDLSLDLADASGVAVLADGTFLVISHESRLVAHYEIDWSTETAIQLGQRSADFFTQLEGIAVMGTADVHLFGEDNTRKGNPGQTYSHLVGELVPPSYSVSDLDCSGTVNVSDALRIAQIRTGLFTPIEGCGSGDHNGDGVVNITDALFIAQCSVGIPNVGCPTGSM